MATINSQTYYQYAYYIFHVKMIIEPPRILVNLYCFPVYCLHVRKLQYYPFIYVENKEYAKTKVIHLENILK